MNVVVAIAVLSCGAIAFLLVLLLRQLATPGAVLPATAAWIDDLSVERYRPMLRLLNGEDLVFMRSEPGYTPKIAAQLRRQRCQVFRGYLRSLTSDFNRVCMAIKVLMIQSQHDRPDLAAVLLRNQIMFAVGVLIVRFRLSLYQWGVAGVEVASLVKIFDIMRLELRSLVPAGIDA
jgi:hypothetical protein